MKKNFLKITTVFGLIAIPIILTGCKTNNSYLFYLSQTANSGDYNVWLTDLETKYNQLINQQDIINEYGTLDKINLKVKVVSDNSAKKDAIENGSALFTFLTSRSLVSNDFYLDTIPTIQTLTTPFTFDTNLSLTYSDGSETDSLRIIADNMQESSFGSNYEYPLSTWNDENGAAPNYDWNGIRYNAFYDESSTPVNGYRGMIVLSGDHDQVNSAIEAWDNKDFDTFRSLGIITGKSSSAGNYLLQEQLIKTHFNLEENWSIAIDKQNYENLYDVDDYGTNKIGKSKDFVISFTDEGSFAWTHNTTTNQDYSPLDGSVIKFLTVTNPAIYDVGVFSKNADTNLVNVLSLAIVSLYEENNNLYGEGLGYNGYQIINDFITEVLNPMKISLGI